jgi:formate dehydrogenase major subunit
MRNQGKFDLVTLRAPKDDPEVGRRLLRSALAVLGQAGAPAPGHPRALRSEPPREGGRLDLPARVRRGAQRRDAARRGSFTKGSELTDGYPEFTMGVLKKLGWDKDLTPEELGIITRSAATRSIP